MKHYIKADWSYNDHGGVDLTTAISGRADEIIRAVAHILDQMMDKAEQAGCDADIVLRELAKDLAEIRNDKEGAVESTTIDLSDWPIKQ